MSINKRLEELVKNYSEGNISQFAKTIGVSHTSIASMMPGSRESKPGFEIIAKIVETFPELNTDWLIKDEPPMIKEGHTKNTFKGNKLRDGNTVTQARDVSGMNTGQDEECRKALAKALEDVDLWRNKYIALLEEMRK